MKLTLQEIKELDQDWITPEQASGALGCTGQYLGWKCHNEPENVQFPFLCLGNKTIIPRAGFINWMEGKKIWAEATE